MINKDCFICALVEISLLYYSDFEIFVLFLLATRENYSKKDSFILDK
jgi:hypothetical protein